MEKRKRTHIELKQMSQKERLEYFRQKNKEYREIKLKQKMLLKRWEWRYIDEKIIFNEDDLVYLKELKRKDKKKLYDKYYREKNKDIINEKRRLKYIRKEKAKKETIYEKIKRLRLDQWIILT